MRKLLDSRNSAAWIAEENGRMAGFAIVEWTPEREGVVAYIQTIEVSPEHRGKGAGRELLRCLEASARNEAALAIWLHVDAENSDAIRLYESNGYGQDGSEEDFYAPGRAAFIYSKPLGSKLLGTVEIS